ncbi:hypothetical protein [Bosea sp. PAMC 26642]|uniref:hypothetical protein n=1 Tax=Bosea sp. (strain PAMC 26642) TaxID=1792307 RepID=UPI000AB0035C|nr:hypothetical protein [Bosea sp. PAMC 26642]
MERRSVTMRDMQKLSAASIRALPRTVPIKSGSDTVGLLVPLKRPDPEQWKSLFERIDRHYEQLSPEVKQYLQRMTGEGDD